MNHRDKGEPRCKRRGSGVDPAFKQMVVFLVSWISSVCTASIKEQWEAPDWRFDFVWEENGCWQCWRSLEDAEV